MRLARLLVVYLNIACVSVIGALLLLALANVLATSYLRNRPDILMSEAERISESTRTVREAMIPRDKVALWYDLDSPDEVKTMWAEFYSAPPRFESYTHFRSDAFMGRYYQVTKFGYRLSRDPGPWPPDPAHYNVFFFGGSTSFGVGPAWATVASYLQEALARAVPPGRKVYVYNFGRSGYFSTQERILFQQLLTEGFVPTMAVFMDGLNDFCWHDGNPSGWRALANYFDRVNHDALERAAAHGIVTRWDQFRDFLISLPVARLVGAWIERAASRGVPQYTGPSAAELDKPESESVLRHVIVRYRENLRQISAIAADYKIQPVFVWQPIPTYSYDAKSHIFYPDQLHCHVNSKVGYPLMADLRAKGAFAEPNFIWAADLQQNRHEPLYIDAFHYTAPMSRDIADFIAAEIQRRNLMAIAPRS